MKDVGNLNGLAVHDVIEQRSELRMLGCSAVEDMVC